MAWGFVAQVSPNHHSPPRSNPCSGRIGSGTESFGATTRTSKLVRQLGSHVAPCTWEPMTGWHSVTAAIRSDVGGDLQAGARASERAVVLNPNLAPALWSSAPGRGLRRNRGPPGTWKTQCRSRRGPRERLEMKRTWRSREDGCLA